MNIGAWVVVIILVIVLPLACGPKNNDAELSRDYGPNSTY